MSEAFALGEDPDVLHPAHVRVALPAFPARLFPDPEALVADAGTPGILTATRLPFRDARLAELARHFAESEHFHFLRCQTGIDQPRNAVASTMPERRVRRRDRSDAIVEAS